MQIVWVTLGWVFGVVATLLGLGYFAEGVVPALAMLGIAALLLPPVRTWVHRVTGRALSVAQRAAAIVACIVAFGVDLNLPIGSSPAHAPTAATPKAATATPKPKAVPAMPAACIAGSERSAKTYDVIGTDVVLYSAPGGTGTKLVNEKASAILKSTEYLTVDDSTRIFEECTNGEWSYIRVTEPEWLRDSHRGWVPTSSLAKAPPAPGDRYSRRITSGALSPYTEQGYPKTVQTYGGRLVEIEAFRRRAAELAIDSGKCDKVVFSELSDSRSSLADLHFWVECRNKERFYLSEAELKAGAAPASQRELAWTKASATDACRAAIKERALMPSEVDVREIIGTSFYEAPTTHNVVLNMDFDAKNALGAMMPYTAICHFEPGRVGTIDIAPRR
jgi:hypothetical protein